jgi:hypothetical protein
MLPDRDPIGFKSDHDLFFSSMISAKVVDTSAQIESGRSDHHPGTRITPSAKPILRPAWAKSPLVAVPSRAIVMCFNYRNAVRMPLSYIRGPFLPSPWLGNEAGLAVGLCSEARAQAAGCRKSMIWWMIRRSRNRFSEQIMLETSR